AVSMNDRPLFEKLIFDLNSHLSFPDGRKSDEVKRFEEKLFYGVTARNFDGLREEWISQAAKDLELTEEEEEINESYSESGSVSEDISESRLGEDATDKSEPLFTKEMVEEEAQTILGFISLSR